MSKIEITGSAVFSPCGKYRYLLRRHIPCILRHVKPVLFILINPSVANSVKPDPTITRLVGYCQSWFATDLSVCNLFSYITPYPKELAKLDEQTAIGPDNDKMLLEQILYHSKIGTIICAWGNNSFSVKRAKVVKQTILDNAPGNLYYLKLNSSGTPAHPLYLKKDLHPTRWE